MRTRSEINADKQAADNKWQRANTKRYLWERDNYMTKDERAEAERIRLYVTHKELGSLGTYYSLYPMDRGARAFYEKLQRENDRER